MRRMSEKTQLGFIALVLSFMCAVGCMGFMGALNHDGFATMQTCEAIGMLFGLTGVIFGAIVLARFH